jgi:DNA-binding CsgD family transcriptional regulator/tetratricopeptide (TPR) repeat protein
MVGAFLFGTRFRGLHDGPIAGTLETSVDSPSAPLDSPSITTIGGVSLRPDPPNDALTALAAGGEAYVDDRLDDARALWEEAFRGLVTLRDQRGAARVATLLGELHWGGLGNPSTGRGWLERARRLLEAEGPCPERGYWELARLACDRSDIGALEASAARALDIASQCGDVGLQTRALADSGFALVCRGRLDEGFARLEEVLAVLTTGEVTDPFAVSTACCALLSACDRAGDQDRAAEWIRVVHDVVLAGNGGRPRMLGAHCELAWGGVLMVAGRTAEAEDAIRSCLDRANGATAAQRAGAAARLAELCVRCGRFEQASAVLVEIEDQPAAAPALASLLLIRGEPATAKAVLDRALIMVPGDLLQTAALLCLLVEVALAGGEAEAAASALDQLRSLSALGTAPVISGTTSYAEAAITPADRPDVARAALHAALADFSAAKQPWHVARTHLALARLVVTSDPPGATAAARAAHAVATRCGFNPIRDESAALLRRLGVVPPRSSGQMLPSLSARESEVLRALTQGKSNADIAAELYLSPKTVEHHVSRILTKLGARTRAEAAAIAAAAEPA